jgi:lysophospholipase L1-like esterase
MKKLRRYRLTKRGVFACLIACALAGSALTEARARTARDSDAQWVGTWASSPQLGDPGNAPPAPGFADSTLRQIVHVSIGGDQIRVRFSNAFGVTPLVISSAHVALGAGGSAIKPESDKSLTFANQPSVTIPAGALVYSDPVDFALAPLSDLVVTIHAAAAPNGITTHPGSRETSYLASGDLVSAATLPAPAQTDHWYFLNGIDVLARRAAATVVTLGDSITDGRGSTTNGNGRWPDDLARRLVANKSTANIGVLNEGIGGNRILHDGLGPNALARFDRDVLAQDGVRWLIVLEGVNDIGTAATAATHNETPATAQDIIAAYEQIILRAHAHGIRAIGATITPFGDSFYSTPATEAIRQAVNTWIRTSGKFDAVIDFDAALRDPNNPTHLLPAADSGDHLHPADAGYKMMADAIDLALFGK